MSQQESDPFFEEMNVKVEPEEMSTIVELQIFKTEIIDLDFQNVEYEEEPLIESVLCMEEIDKLVIENTQVEIELKEPMSKQKEEGEYQIVPCVKCIKVIKHKDRTIAFREFRKHMMEHNREQHMCLLCEPPVRFAQSIHLDHHSYILHEIGTNPLICKECNFISDIEDKNYWDNQRAHLKRHIQPMGFFHEHSYTKNKFSSEIRLQNHQFIEDNSGVNPSNQRALLKEQKQPLEFHCDFCDPKLKFPTQIKLQVHQFNMHQHGIHPLKCKVCHKKLGNKKKMKEHSEICKPRPLMPKLVKVVPKTYKCYLCDEVFEMGVTKVDHINTVHADKANADCHLCLRKRIPSATAFEKHVSEHMVEYTLICSYCGRGFFEESRLNTHIKYLHEIKYLTCDICGVKHKYTQSLRKHMQSVHLKMRNYECNECPRAYTSSAILELHQVKKHGAEPRYKCDKCTAGFTFRFEYSRHILSCTPGIYAKEKNRVATRVFPTPTLKDGRTVCPGCYKDFSSQGSWITHYYAEHLYEKTFYECDVCHKVSNKLGNHKKHMMIHSEVKPHVCDICNKSFAQKTTMQTHR